MFGGSARGWGCVKVYSHWEVLVWEEGTASGCPSPGVCEMLHHRVSPGQTPSFCPFHVHGTLCQRLSRLLSRSSLLISSSQRTCTNHLCKPCSVIPHALIPRNPLCRHGGAAQVSAQLVSLSALLLLVSYLGVAEGRKLWKGLHQAHRLSVTFSNPDECV